MSADRLEVHGIVEHGDIHFDDAADDLLERWLTSTAAEHVGKTIRVIFEVVSHLHP